MKVSMPGADPAHPAAAAHGRRRLLKAGLMSAAAAATAGTTGIARAQGRPRTYVLVHGAWFGGWVWKGTAASLRAMGHTVYAPTLTGLGERRHLARPGINLDTHADDVVNLIEMEDLNQIVLVGWSYGGMVATDVLARVPGRIASMVYLDAFVPDRGRSMMSYANRSGTPEGLIQLSMQGKDMGVLPINSLAVDDPKIIEYCTARCVPHPVNTVLQASKALTERPNIPHTYVLAGQYAKRSQTFAPFHKQFSEDSRWQAHVIDAGHVMMLTAPEATLKLITEAR